MLRVAEHFKASKLHLVGLSMGGRIARNVALRAPERLHSLVLISTSPALPGDRQLPPPTDEFGRFVSTAHVDWTDKSSVIDYLVVYSRMLAGDRRPFDEASVRDLVGRDIERASDFTAAQNQDVILDDDRQHSPLCSITAPTLVVHGTADPMFPIEHGEALAREIPGAKLLRFHRAGHGLQRDDWHTITHLILDHTAATPAAG